MTTGVASESAAENEMKTLILESVRGRTFSSTVLQLFSS